MILSVAMISRGISGVRAGWSEKGEYSGLGYTPNKRGYIQLPDSSSKDSGSSYSAKGAIKRAKLPTRGKIRYIPPDN